MEIVDRNKVPHAYIDIELTETTTDVEFTALKRLVTQLHQAGISTSVDDFGVGYSSLNLIKEIPWNVLKLDRALLPSPENQGRGSRMFRHVIAMAHEIDMVCVAEGIETQAQLETLRSNGCRVAQGFYFIGTALPIACCGYFSAVKQGRVSAAGIATIAKKPEASGKTALTAAMVELYALLALLISFLLVINNPF